MVRPRLGQHFLLDSAVAGRIVDALASEPIDGVPVEIGPGKGALTRPLLKRFGKLYALEKDPDLVRFLNARLPADNGLRLYRADALHFDFRTLAGPGERLWLVGNLPYAISTALLFHLLLQRDHLAGMIFMLQREVARRVAAPPGGADYGRLSVMVQYWCEAETLFEVPAHAFVPPPRVTSAVLRLRLRPAPRCPARDANLYANLVFRAFSQRRKTLRNALCGLAEEHHFIKAKLSPAVRAQTLSPEDFAHLSNVLSESGRHPPARPAEPRPSVASGRSVRYSG